MVRALCRPTAAHSSDSWRNIRRTFESIACLKLCVVNNFGKNCVLHQWSKATIVNSVTIWIRCFITLIHWRTKTHQLLLLFVWHVKPSSYVLLLMLSTDQHVQQRLRDAETKIASDFLMTAAGGWLSSPKNRILSWRRSTASLSSP